MSLPFHLERITRVLLAVALLAALSASGQTRAIAPPQHAPDFAAIDAVVQNAIANQEFPGAVVIVGHRGEVVYRKSFGARAWEPQREVMPLDTIFDIASLTKPVATATSVMRMVQRGQVRLNDPVKKYLPEFAANGKEEITVRQLLTHFSGLREDLDVNEPWTGKDEGLRRAFAEKPIRPPGAEFRYSDINYIVLGALVERVSGMTLDQYAQANIFKPLHMEDTRFLPAPAWLPRIAPTEFAEQNRMLRGIVHDPTTRRMGGVAGHAGVFSTADDLAKFAQEMLTGSTVLTRATILKMTTPQQPTTAPVLRGLGWDIDSPFASNRGDLLPLGSFGHTGFTGTSLWIDPTTQTYIIIMTNAVHPRGGKQTTVSLRNRVATAVATAFEDEGKELTDAQQAKLLAITGYNESNSAERHLQWRNGAVLTGIDVLEQDNFKQLLGPNGGERSIGLLTNATGVDREGHRTIDLLAKAPHLQLKAILSPEHGIAASADSVQIENSKDSATGVPVYSVYGAGDAKKHPPMDVVRSVDALVIDLQDAGARFYTYETTLGYFLEAAAAAGKPIYVLDRPNPITGSMVQGPMSVSREGVEFTNYHPLPVRHGMTLGELAQLFNGERKIGAALTVVPMQGWLRGDWFDATGLAWSNPSPNLRSLTDATLYPGVALIEGTNVSVGRGTDTPFEVVGAPWIKGRELASYLNGRMIGGVRFVPTSFKPMDNQFAKQVCEGVNIVVIDRFGFDAPELGLELASALHKLYPKDFQIESMQSLLANHAVYQALIAGEDPRRIRDEQDQLQHFLTLRERYLLYQ